MRSKTRDMTQGSPTPVMLSFAVPILLGNLFQQFYNTVDAIVVGQYEGEAAIAAIGVANPIMSIAIFFLFGVCIGISVLLAQLYGAQDWDTFRLETSTALIGGLVFSIGFSLFCFLLAEPLLRITQTPPDILEPARGYLQIISLGLVFSFLYNFCAAGLRATGDSRAPFLFLLCSSLLNIALDIAFVGGLGMGVQGAAAATVLSQAVSCLLSVVYIYRTRSILALRRGQFRFDMGLMKKTASYSWASALQQTFIYIGRLLVQTVVNTFGTSVIAGYNSAVRIEGFLLSTQQAMGDSEATFCAQNAGARRLDRVRAGFWGANKFNLAYSVLLGVLLAVFAPALIRLFTNSGQAEMIPTGVFYLRFMIPFYMLSGVTNAMQGMFRGIGMLRLTAACTALQIVWRIIFSYLFGFQFGLPAICLATGTGWVIMVIVEGVYVKRYFDSHREMA